MKKRRKKIDHKTIKRHVDRGIKIFDALLILAFVILAIVAIYNQQYLEEFVLKELQNYGLIVLFFINFLLEFIPQMITPVATLLPSLALGLNPHLTILFVVSGSLIGSIAGYEVGTKYGFSVLTWLFEEVKIQKAVDFMNKYGKIAVFLAAISPLPYIPMVIGALKMSKKNFSLFGLLPRAIGLAVAGYSFYIIAL